MNIGYASAAASVAMLGASVALHWPGYVRALVFFPAALSATCFLQAMRNTCVARAMEGTFEHDDFSKTPAPADEVAASRRVARTIQRDALVIGVVSAAIGYASTFV